MTAVVAPGEARSVTSRALRQVVVEQVKRANVGHAGSALSVADIMVTLYGELLASHDPADPDRDRVVLSKGHAALACYAALYLRGWLGRDELDTFCGNDTLLGVHPVTDVPGVDFCTGSLGHGLPMAVGAALAARLAGSDRRVYVVVSDAECNEGSTWEAAMFAAHHKLANLVVFIDDNGQQSFGYSKDVLMPTPLARRWEAFGWDTRTVDGHDVPAMTDTVRALPSGRGEPHVLVCRTVFGSGVSFMEGRIAWHYARLDDDQYARALADIAELP